MAKRTFRCQTWPGARPEVFERSEPYAVVAAFASIRFLVSDKLTGNPTLSTSIGVAAGFLMRALALRFSMEAHRGSSRTVTSGERRGTSLGSEGSEASIDQ